jgi:hypothetical protein
MGKLDLDKLDKDKPDADEQNPDTDAGSDNPDKTDKPKKK